MPIQASVCEDDSQARKNEIIRLIARRYLYRGIADPSGTQQATVARPIQYIHEKPYVDFRSAASVRLARLPTHRDVADQP